MIVGFSEVVEVFEVVLGSNGPGWFFILGLSGPVPSCSMKSSGGSGY